MSWWRSKDNRRLTGSGMSAICMGVFVLERGSGINVSGNMGLSLCEKIAG